MTLPVLQAELEKESLRRALDQALGDKVHLLSKVSKLEDDVACARMQSKLSARTAAEGSSVGGLMSPVAPARPDAPPTGGPPTDTRRLRYRVTGESPRVADTPRSVASASASISGASVDATVALLTSRVKELERDLAESERQRASLHTEASLSSATMVPADEHEQQVQQYEAQVRAPLAPPCCGLWCECAAVLADP